MIISFSRDKFHVDSVAYIRQYSYGLYNTIEIPYNIVNFPQ